MKHLILVGALVGLLFHATTPARAQAVQGEIVYQEQMRPQQSMDDLDPYVVEMIKRSLSTNTVLRFDGRVSKYQPLASGNNTAASNVSVINLSLNSGETLYRNLETRQVVRQLDFLSRQFLVKEELSQPRWKLTQETQTILGYNCTLATTEIDSISYEAWFTMDIPLSTGPGKLWGLPGAILAVNIDGGTRTIIAQQVEFKELDEDALSIPKKGKEITNEELKALQAEKLEEVKGIYGADDDEGRGVSVIKN